MRNQVFICYATPDLDTAKKFYIHFKKANIKAWLAPKRLHPGDNWKEKIVEGLDKSALLFLLWSKAAAESENVEREISLAVEEKLAIVRVNLDETPLVGGPRYDLCLFQKHSLATWEPSEVLAITNSVRRALAERGVAPAGYESSDKGGTTFLDSGDIAIQSYPRNLPDIGEYEILEVIGHGGMGVVYKARQRSNQRIVALKTILGGEHADADFKSRFWREARLASKLNHPNIVPVLDVGEHNGQPYFCMEYVPGTNLAQKTVNQPLRPRQRRAMSKQWPGRCNMPTNRVSCIGTLNRQTFWLTRTIVQKSPTLDWRGRLIRSPASL